MQNIYFHPKAFRAALIIFTIILGRNIYCETPENNVAVIDFEAVNAPATEADIITDFIRSGMVEAGVYTVVDKANMRKILSMQAFQQTGCTDTTCAVKLGRILNVGKIVVGKYAIMGKTRFLTCSLVHVETGKIEKTAKTKGFTAETADEAATTIVKQLCGKETAEQTQNIPNNTLTNTNKIYSPGGQTIIWKDGSKMIKIPAGKFKMGTIYGDTDEIPVHEVFLDEYYIDEKEVTNQQFANFLNEIKFAGNPTENELFTGNMIMGEQTGAWQPHKGWEQHPAVRVTWNGAKAYAAHYGKQLPTEAQWEKACRGGSNEKWHFGNDEKELAKYANYAQKGKIQDRNPGGLLAPNPYGLYDMHGNVWEWCADKYQRKYYSVSPARNPTGPIPGERYVLRGGSYKSNPNECRVAYRKSQRLEMVEKDIGFRCVYQVAN